MPREVVERYQRWLEYERDAHEKVVRSLETVPPDRRSGPEYRRAVSILAHVAAARRLWLGRLGVTPMPSGPLFPEGAELAQVADGLRSVGELWADYLARLGDDDIARTFEYQSLDAGRFRNRVEDILAQLSGHSC